MRIEVERISGFGAGLKKEVTPRTGPDAKKADSASAVVPLTDEVPHKLFPKSRPPVMKAASTKTAKALTDEANSAKRRASRTKRCSHCKAQMLASSTICPHCGGQDSKGPGLLLGLFIALILVFLAGGLGVAWLIQEPAPNPDKDRSTQESTEAREAPPPKTEAAPAKAKAEPADQTRPREPKTDQASGTRPAVTNKWGMRFVPIKAGEFLMGRKHANLISDYPGTLRQIENEFNIQTTEVTWEQWLWIMEGESATREMINPNHPADMISWLETQELINRLNEADQVYSYRLPTETEWEYACRAGTDDAFFFDWRVNRLEEYAWIKKNTTQTAPVGVNRPNPWGLYDTYGNVWEWCSDWYQQDSKKVLRGGSFKTDPDKINSCLSAWAEQTVKHPEVGFHLVMTPRYKQGHE